MSSGVRRFGDFNLRRADAYGVQQRSREPAGIAEDV